MKSMKKLLLTLLLLFGGIISLSAERTYPQVLNLTLISANTEYSITLPSWTKAFTVQCRTAYDLRMATVTGKVATSISPYFTIKSGYAYFDSPTANSTLYFASSEAGVVVEIMAWGINSYES